MTRPEPDSVIFDALWLKPRMFTPNDVMARTRVILAALDEAGYKVVASDSAVDQPLIEAVTSMIRESNNTPEAREAWAQHPQIVPAHIYAKAAIAAVRAVDQLRMEVPGG